jgi:hypothetical protein
MFLTKEQVLRDPKLSTDVKTVYGVTNRGPRNGEYVGPHSTNRVKESAQLAEKYRQKVPCGPNHFVYSSGLIARRRKMKY